MTIFELMMEDPIIRKQVLIQFGFGEINPKRAENWYKKFYPPMYHQLKRKAKAQKVVQFSVEGMAKEERDRLLDLEQAYSDLVKKGDY
jgi:hypothetical protein